jgi:general secretion pathway protein A
MHWLTPEIGTNVALGICMGLFVLLVLSVRKKKMATSIPFSFQVSPLRGAFEPSLKSKSTPVLRRAIVPAPPVGILLSTGLEHTGRETAKCKVPDAAEKPLPAPLEFTAVGIPEQPHTNCPSFSFECFEPAPQAEITEITATVTEPIVPAEAASSSANHEIRETAEPCANQTMMAKELRATEESASEASIAVKTCEPERNKPEEVAANGNGTVVGVRDKRSGAKDVLGYYGLPQQPFDVTPDPAYLYFSPSHREAMTSLKDGVAHCRGFMVLAAEPGMGKTTLLNKLMDDLSDTAQVVFLFQTQCSSRELLCFILNELEVDHAGMDVVGMHRALNQALLEEMLRGRRFVLIVDEAQNLQEPVLETIRLLSDFETTHSKLIQIILAGQPQLAETLMRPGLVQLRQRIAVLSSLQTLSAAETAEYIEHRLRASGWEGTPLFTEEAMAQIARSSGGVPRRINNLCFNSLLEGFHRGIEVINGEIVKIAAEKLNLEALVRRAQAEPASEPPAAPALLNGASELAQALAAAINAEMHPNANGRQFRAPAAKSEAVLRGTLTEKVRSQGWSDRHEYRILVTLEHVPVKGVHVADRYYCCSLFLGEAQAASLMPGKPVRIKIEQD